MKEKTCKRITTVFLAVIMLLLFFGRTEAQAQRREDNQKIVRVGWYQSNMFQDGFSDGQMKSGYCYDYLQKESDYTNWEYEYVYGNWTELFPPRIFPLSQGKK